MIVYPYKKGLNSTKMLREEGCRVRYATSHPAEGTAIAWGCRKVPPWSASVHWINHPAAIPLVADKKNWAKFCKEYKVGPEQTQCKEEALGWSATGSIVMCRTLLNASGGRGIVIARSPEELVQAPLYSRYVRKQREYRIVYSPITGTIYAASKRKRGGTDYDQHASLIRTKEQGFVYQTEDIATLPDCVNSAVAEVGILLQAKGLNLLAYDVTFNTKKMTSCVIEVNTAWGLNGDSAKVTYEAMQRIEELKGWS